MGRTCRHGENFLVCRKRHSYECSTGHFAAAHAGAAAWPCAAFATKCVATAVMRISWRKLQKEAPRYHVEYGCLLSLKVQFSTYSPCRQFDDCAKSTAPRSQIA